MPKAGGKEERWSYGGFYLDRPHPTRGGLWYACRYDTGSRNVRRKSLGTADFEDAKQRLVELAAIAPFRPEDAPHPRDVLTVDVMRAYLAGHATGIRTEAYVARAVDLVAAYLKDKATIGAPVSFWTPSRQLEFAGYLVERYSHKASTIERIFNVVSAAFKDAARVKLRSDPLGSTVEGSLVSHVPDFVYKKATLTRELKLPDAKPKVFVPTMDEMARFIDALHYQHLRRWIVLALATWARPEAITDFLPARQWDRRTNEVRLDIEGRPMTNKRRPTILACQTLQGALVAWHADDLEDGADPAQPWYPLTRGTQRIGTVKRGVKLTAEKVDLKGITQKTPRTFMATMVAKLCPHCPRDKRSIWLGHAVAEGSRTTDHYEIHDSSYLADVALATDFVLQQLQALCREPFLAVEPLLNEAELARLGAVYYARLRRKSEG